MIAAPAPADKIPRVILRVLRAGLRRVFNLSFLAALSLLLGIGLGCLWPRTIRVNDWLICRRSSGQAVKLGTLPDQFYFSLYTRWGVSLKDQAGWYYHSELWNPQDLDWYQANWVQDSWLGFKLIPQDLPYQGGVWHITGVIIPLWFPMVLTPVAPLCWLRRWRRQARRVRLGLCLHCGYDLRATPAPTGPRVPRCPECGRESS
jgi:hypothetical protein